MTTPQRVQVSTEPEARAPLACTRSTWKHPKPLVPAVLSRTSTTLGEGAGGRPVAGSARLEQANESPYQALGKSRQLVLHARIGPTYHSPLALVPCRLGGSFELLPISGHKPERLHQCLESGPVWMGIACLQVLQTTHTDAGSFRKLSLGHTGRTSRPEKDRVEPVAVDSHGLLHGLLQGGVDLIAATFREQPGPGSELRHAERRLLQPTQYRASARPRVCAGASGRHSRVATLPACLSVYCVFVKGSQRRGRALRAAWKRS
jgi:hypothetical protein